MRKGLRHRPRGAQDRPEARPGAAPGPGKEARLFSTTSWSVRPAPAPGRDDRWPPKERSLSREQRFCVGRRRAGWGAF